MACTQILVYRWGPRTGILALFLLTRVKFRLWHRLTVNLHFQNREDISQDPRGSLWVPSIKKVIKELLSLGARVPRLFPGDLVTQLNIKEILSDSSSEDMEDVTGSGKPQTERFPLVNIMHLVQFLTHCLQKCPRCYVVQELQNLAVLLCRLALDVRLQTVVFDIEMCLAAALNCFGEMQWPDEV